MSGKPLTPLPRRLRGRLPDGNVLPSSAGALRSLVVTFIEACLSMLAAFGLWRSFRLAWAKDCPILPSSPTCTHWLHALMLVVLSLAIYLVLDQLFDLTCDEPRIRRLPCIPGYPIVGNLFQLGPSQCLTYLRWSQHYGPVFQMRLGTKRVVVANSYDAAKYLWVDHMAANASRPISYTFHRIVSSSQGYTIGTTPWSATYRRERAATDPVLNKPAIRSYMYIIDREANYCIRSMFRGIESAADNGDLHVHPYFNTYALNTSLTLNYGIRLDDVDRDLLTEIMQVEKMIGRFRGSFHNYADYFPFLRLFSLTSTKLAVEYRQRRDKYLDTLLGTLRANIVSGTSPPCITGNILQDGMSQVSEQELRSICLTMVSAGLDTVPAMLIYFIGHMSLEHGQEIQHTAYQMLCEAYPDSQPWHKCLEEDNIPYIRALVKETLRFSAMPLSLPRKTIKDIEYQNTVIPAGSTLFLNAFAANFDPAHFDNPCQFNPERYLCPQKGRGPPHFAFGAGTRMCAGANLAERELYIAFVRIICAFQILPPSNPLDAMISDPRELIREHNALMIDPPHFKVRLVPRDPEQLRRLLAESDELLGP